MIFRATTNTFNRPLPHYYHASQLAHSYMGDLHIFCHQPHPEIVVWSSDCKIWAEIRGTNELIDLPIFVYQPTRGSQVWAEPVEVRT